MAEAHQNEKLASWAGLAAGAVTAAGCFLPWLTATIPLAGTITRSGVDGGGDGILIVWAMVIVAVISAVRVVRPVPAWLGGAVIALGAGSGLVGLVSFADVQERVDAVNETAELAGVGGGMFLTLGGCAAVVAAGFLMLLWKQARPESAQAPASSGGAAQGWYPDPSGVAADRWWNGTGWTENVRHAGAHQD